MKLNHLGFAARDIDGVVDAFVKLGYKPMYDAIKHHVPKNMYVMRLYIGDNIIEIMSPADTSKSCFLDEALSITSEPFMLHHICYDVDDIHKTFDELMATGEYTVFEPITSGVFQKNLIGFLHHQNIGYIEFFEWPKE